MSIEQSNKILASDVTASLNEKAPTSHASSATTYGIGTGSNYGHVKLSDSTTSTSAASAGIAASPAAVKAAMDKANASITGLSVSGKVITYTKGDGTTGTITTQDTNTTYSAGTGISISSNKITNTGVTSVNGKTGAVTIGNTVLSVNGVNADTSGNVSIPVFICNYTSAAITIPSGGTWLCMDLSSANGSDYFGVDLSLKPGGTSVPLGSGAQIHAIFAMRTQ